MAYKPTHNFYSRSAGCHSIPLFCRQLGQNKRIKQLFRSFLGCDPSRHHLRPPGCGAFRWSVQSATVQDLDWPLQWALGFSSTSSLFGYAGQAQNAARAAASPPTWFLSCFMGTHSDPHRIASNHSWLPSPVQHDQ